MSTSSATGAKSAKSYSCVRCFERKVKCDRESPCSNCARSNHECIFRVPPAPRRRKKRTQEEILKARLDRYEQLLKDKGIDVQAEGGKPDDLPEDDEEPSPKRQDSTGSLAALPTSSSDAVHPSRNFVSGKLMVDKGRTRFIENGLWTYVSEEFKKPADAIDESDGDEDAEEFNEPDFILGLTPTSPTVRDLHPLPEQVYTLWQVFLENVNPLSKLIHAPSLGPKIFQAAADIENIPKNLEVLMFAIYAIAVLSMQADDCQNMLGEDRQKLLTRYRTGTRRALARAKFMGTSDVTILTAFVLHLLASRDVYDSRTLWTLTGVASRMAEGMGVHKDGEALGLPIFETEMRRRLWWQTMMLDFRTAELSGSGHSLNLASWDVKIPLNVNDADIWPGMKEPPTPSLRQTEMVFCLTRYEMANYWKAKLLPKNPGKDFQTVWTNFKNIASIEEKDTAIADLERHLEQTYVRYCDPSVAVEFMAIIVARAATNTMRLMTHHPRRYPKEEDVPESERKFLWDTAIKLVETDSITNNSRSMKRFLWHTDHYFQWSALIYILEELKRKPQSEYTEKGWQQVHTVFQNHPDLATKPKKPIYYAVGNLVLKAWKARELANAENVFSATLFRPEYIEILKQQRQDTQTNKEQQPANTNPFPTPTESTNFNISPNTQPTGGNPLHQMPGHPMMPPGYVNFASPTALPFADVTQPQYYWWDYNNIDNNNDIDFSTMQFNQPMQDVPMDWSQWDVLLKDIRPVG